jgi:hypothetical protein
MLITCPECGKELSEQADACPHCGCPINADEEPAPAPAKPEWGAIAFLSALVIAAVLWFFGSYHIVQSSARPMALVGKVHWTLSETFVSMDEITGMPYFAAQMKYPLAVKALQREGFLESDEHRQQRIEAEAKAATEKAMREGQVEAERMQREAEAQLRTEHPEWFH